MTTPVASPPAAFQNGWLMTCHECGTYDLVGPGHPAVKYVPDTGMYGVYDRTKFRHDHGPDCVNDPESGYSLDWSFANMPRSGVVPKKPLGLIGTQLLFLKAFAVYRLMMAAAGMTDQTLVNTLLSNLLHASTTATWTPGTGGTTLTITPPLRLHLMSTTGTETATGTENVAATSPGYTSGLNATGGSSMGANAFGAGASGSTSNSNQVQWTATGTWSLGVAGLEVYDGASTAVRILWGALTTAIIANAVTNTDTITFAAASITANASTW
ncbi:MAG: hypothetical protein ABSG46_20230 [Candidatus Binataceae bacterium]